MISEFLQYTIYYRNFDLMFLNVNIKEKACVFFFVFFQNNELMILVFKLSVTFCTFFFRRKIMFWIPLRHEQSWFINVWIVLMESHVTKWWVLCMPFQGFIFHKKPFKKLRWLYTTNVVYFFFYLLLTNC